MSGVVVHAEHVYRETPVGVVVLIFVLTAVVLAILAWETTKSFRDKYKGRWGAAALLALFVGFFGIVDVAALNSTLTIHTDKIVTIDDTVRFNEFYDNYEIISQDGNLYTVRELQTAEANPNG